LGFYKVLGCRSGVFPAARAFPTGTNLRREAGALATILSSSDSTYQVLLDHIRGLATVSRDRAGALTRSFLSSRAGGLDERVLIGHLNDRFPELNVPFNKTEGGGSRYSLAHRAQMLTYIRRTYFPDLPFFGAKKPDLRWEFMLTLSEYEKGKGVSEKNKTKYAAYAIAHYGRCLGINDRQVLMMTSLVNSHLFWSFFKMCVPSVNTSGKGMFDACRGKKVDGFVTRFDRLCEINNVTTDRIRRDLFDALYALYQIETMSLTPLSKYQEGTYRWGGPDVHSELVLGPTGKPKFMNGFFQHFGENGKKREWLVQTLSERLFGKDTT